MKYLQARINNSGIESIIAQGSEITGNQWLSGEYIAKEVSEAEETATEMKNSGSFSSYDVQIEISGFTTLSKRPEFIRLEESNFDFEEIEIED